MYLLGQMLEQETCFKRLKRISWVDVEKLAKRGIFQQEKKMRLTDIGRPFRKNQLLTEHHT